MTEIGEIPEEWKIDKVSNLKESMHYGITAKSTEQRSHLRFLRTTDISNFNFDPNDLHYCEITGTKPDLSKYYLKQGDIIVARAGTVGVSVLVKRDLPNTIFGSYLIKIAFNKDLIYANFVHYYFQSDIYWNKLRAAQGSTIKNISLPFLRALLLPVPPLQEQQKIAKILSTADEAIQKVNEEITLTERLEKGLLQTLLTKGIGHTKFKMTEIGEIPEEWDFTKMGHPKVSEKMKAGGTPLKSVKDYYKNGTIPFVKIEDIVNSSKYLTRTLEFISANGLRNSSSWLTPKESILFSMYASYGEVCINKISVATNQAIISVIPNKENVDVNFLYYELKNLKNSLKQYIRSTTQSNLNAEIVRGLKIILPPLPEQQKIAEILSMVDNKLELLRKKKTRLEKLKRGLMGDLLTGKVRVKLNKSKGEN